MRCDVLFAGLLLAGGCLASAPVAAQPSFEVEQTCWDELQVETPEAQIAACTELLDAAGLPAEDRAALIAMRGWSYHEMGDLDRALAEYSETIRLEPEAPTGYGWRGSVYLDKEDYARALDDYSKAIDLAGGDEIDIPVWYQDRATAKRLLGDHSGAIADYTTALEAGGDNAGAFLLRGYVHFELGDYPLAIDDYTRAINLAPDVASNWNDRCWGRAVWGEQLVEARDDCNEAIALDAGDFNAWDSRGLIGLREQDWHGALADYQASLDIEPSASAHFGRGIALKRLGDEDQAAEAFAQAAALDPAIAETYAGFGIAP